MGKAKSIMKKMTAVLVKSCKRVCDRKKLLSRIIVFLLVLMMAAGIVLLCSRKSVQDVIVSTETHTVVDIKSGDTLSKILGDQGFSFRDIDAISKNLKKDASFSTLRAGRDKIDFVRESENAPISKIIIENGPWKKIEIDCGTPDTWQCQQIEIARDTRLAYKSGEIAQGSSFYLSALEAGIPEGIILDVYDLLAFEMDFERDIRAGQKFYVLYEENFASDK